MAVIKKINTGSSVYDIDAAYLGSRSASDWEAMIHGAIETYVVPTSKSSATAYSKIVGVTGSTITLTQAELKSLVTPAKEFKVGDVILLEDASTDSSFIFDRWISAIEGTSDSSAITLAILETHVQTHHHTITDNKSTAVTGVTTTSTGTLAKVGSAVTVVTGVSGTPSVMTGVAYSGTGSHSIQVAAGTSSDGVGHSHSISAHSHSFTPTALVSENVDAYTSLSTSSFTPHTHGTSSVAGAHKNSGAITYATGVSSVSGTYVVDLKETSTSTGGKELTTNANAAANTSSITVASASTIDSAKTSSAGSHTHTVSTTTTESVVKTVTLASKVATGISKITNNTTVAATVVTSVSYASQKVLTGVNSTTSANFFNSATVDASGILSFGTAKALTGHTLTSLNVNVVKSVGTGSQSTSAPTITLTTADQSSTSGTVTASGTAASAGGHQHGFNHTHAIPTHTHGISSHTHTYAKTTVSSTGTPTVTLSTSSYTPHTHTSVTVVGSTTNDSNPISYVYGGGKTTVVKTLKSSAVSTGTKELTTDSKYYKVTGTITLPTLKPTTASLSTMLSTRSITPATAGEAAVKSITPSTAQFVTDVVDKTSENKPGK